MPESVYKIIELVGTSTDSWEKAAAAAVTKASKTLRDLRIAEVSELDIQLENAAEYYGRELEYKLKKLTGLFEPAVIIFMGVIVGFVAVDGESHWMEGVMLVGVYLMLAMAFFFLPA